MNHLDDYCKCDFFPTEDQIRVIPDFADAEILRCVTYIPQGVPHHCFDNCSQLVHEHGGESIDGWRFLLQPWQQTRGFMSVSAHTVWRHPDGTIYDPTPFVNESGLNVPADGMPFIADPMSFVTDQRVVPLSGNKELKRFCRRLQVEANQLVRCMLGTGYGIAATAKAMRVDAMQRIQSQA